MSDCGTLFSEKCRSCRLQERNHKCVPGHGPPPHAAKAVVVGEAPGRDEVTERKPFVGISGQLLRAALRAFGLHPDDDVYLTNVVKCRPPGNRLQDSEVAACKQDLRGELLPFVEGGVPLLLVGNTAAEVVIGSIFESSMRGRWQMNDKVLPTWHPAFILREPVRFWEFYFAVRKIARGRVPPLEPDYRVVEYPDQLIEAWIDLTQAPDATLCFDLETEQAVPYWKHDILSMAIAYEDDKAIVLTEEILHSTEGREFLTDLFELPRLKFVGQKVKFDLRYLKHDLHIHNAHAEYDTMLAHWVLYEDASHGLKEMANDYFDAPAYDEALDRYINRNTNNWRGVPPEVLYHYNALDVCYNLKLWNELSKELHEDGLFEKPFLFPIMASQPPLLKAELAGMPVDEERLVQVSRELEQYAYELHMTLEDMAGVEFNPRSWMQVSPIMYDHYNAPKVRGRGFKVGSTCKQARARILQQIDPKSELATWLKLYGQYRSVVKLKSTYVDGVLDDIAPDGRVHADTKVHGARTGRMAVGDPPLHSIPHPGRNKPDEPDWGIKIRSCFVAPPGHTFIMADYSQAELRVVACMSQDPFMIEAYRQGKDLHSEAARFVYGEDFTPRHRQICKSVNFSQVYGGSPESVAQEADMDMEAIRHLSARYHELYSRMYQWRDDQFDKLREQGYIETCTGRRRRFPVITRSNLDDARKAAVNSPVQGSASELTLISFIRMDEWLRENHLEGKAWLVLTVHDSIEVIAKEDYAKAVANQLSRIMERTGKQYFPEVPWKVDVEMGPSWGEVQ